MLNDDLPDATIMSLLSAHPLAQLLVGPNERILADNPGAIALFGAGLRGRHYITVLRQPALLDCIEGVLGGGDMARAPYLSTGATRDTAYQVTVGPVILTTGRAALIAFEDVTAVQEAGQMRRDFVANVSHELRTPLTALLGFIETLRGAARRDPAAQDRFLAIMAHEAERMNRLVHDLLSLSRVESEERIRPTEAVDVHAIVQSVATSLRPLAAEANVVVAVEGEEDACVAGDGDQLAQVFTNLVENGIKYGAQGGIVRATVMRLKHDPSLRGPSVRVDVTDKGEGIDPIHVPRLTERFYRVDTHRSREMGGTGLGLAIVKHIVSRHRGRLRISSSPGAGSTFSVILPAIADGDFSAGSPVPGDTHVAGE